MKKKIRLHRRCPCGSKKKYRNCCGKKKTVDFNDLSGETQKLYRNTQLKHQIASQHHDSHLGHTPEIVSCVFQGKRLVGLGNTIVQSDSSDRDWQEPADFLTTLLETILGDEWFDEEFKKAREERHLILNWAEDSNYKVLGPTRPLGSCKLNGSALAYLHLAYDLFALHNEGHVTDSLLSRLKSNQSFNGARYELFVLATMIRAGFDLELFDETLGAGKVTECKAKHIQTGVTVQVEAKTRNIKNVLGAAQGKRKKIRLYGKLKDALEKDVKQPYIIFVDLNLPELNVHAGHEKRKKIRKEHEKLIQKYPNDLPNVIIYTNIPFHYAREDKSIDSIAFGIVKINKPKVALKNESIIINALRRSLDQYKYLPWEFNESGTFAADILKQFKYKNSAD